MLNLLIAVMGDSFDKVKAGETAAAMLSQAQTIVEYECLLTRFGIWKAGDTDRFPRYMVIAEEEETEEADTGEGFMGRMRKHLAASADMAGKRVDSLHDEMKQQHEAVDAKVAAVESKLTEQHEETKKLLAEVMSRLDGVPQ